MAREVRTPLIFIGGFNARVGPGLGAVWANGVDVGDCRT